MKRIILWFVLSGVAFGQSATFCSSGSNCAYTGNNTHSGSETFSGSTTVPTPTLPAQAATKAYVDASAGMGGLPLTGGTLTGPLNGTSANFSGSITAGTTTPTSIDSSGVHFPDGTVQSGAVNFGNVTYAANYGVKANGMAATNASWSASTANPTVTISASDLSFTSAMTGEECFGTTGGFFGTTSLPLGTFTYLTSTTGKCSSTSTTAAVSNGQLFVGPDDTTAYQAAYAAYTAKGCGAFIMPQGWSGISQGIGNVAPSGCVTGDFWSDEYSAELITGQGKEATHLVPLPGFQFSTCVTNGCFFSNGLSGTHLRDFSITGLGQSLNGVSTAPATTLITLSGQNAEVDNVWLTEWASQAVVNGISLTGQSGYARDLEVGYFGAGTGGHYAIQVSAYPGPFELIDCWANGSIALNIVSYGGSGTVSDYGGQYQGDTAVQMNGTTKYYWYGGGIQGFGTRGIYMANSNNFAYLNGVQWGILGTSVPAAFKGIEINGTGNNYVFAMNSGIWGGSTNGPVYQDDAGPNYFHDQGGNIFVGPTTTFTGQWFTDSISPSGATIPTIGSGFGTSPSVSGTNGTAAFMVNVGTGASASSGIITMPAARTGWTCDVHDRTARAANATYDTYQTASSATSVTIQNQTLGSGAAVAWAASDIVALRCVAY